MDIVDNDEVAAAIDAFGERYLDRISSRGERQSWPGDDRRLRSCAAGTFAGKEAVLKTLGVSADKVSWRDIELQQSTNGMSVTLHGEAAVVAAEAGVQAITVSISSTDVMTLAVAIATKERGSGACMSV